MSVVLVIHGGAWAIPDELAPASVQGVKAAARHGSSVLRRHGATLNIDGEVELDAIIVDGKTLACGAVSCVKNIANPVSLARAVMEKVVLFLLGANKFAESIGITMVPTDKLVTEYERKEWEKHKKYILDYRRLSAQLGMAHDTVGAVALDSAGNVACATPTGGIRNKMVGRVGDSLVIVNDAIIFGQRFMLFHLEYSEILGFNTISQAFTRSSHIQQK
uniref:Si:dkey-103j14.5 n=1 Tax=Cyprinodon variegatus TaxID=28743 RepID=A0A3Q2EHZ3_CYPVA